VYMARAPDGVDVADWDGDGQVWFKVLEGRPTLGGGSMGWPTNGQRGYTFKIPASIPTGQFVNSLSISDLRSHGLQVPSPNGTHCLALGRHFWWCSVLYLLRATRHCWRRERKARTSCFYSWRLRWQGMFTCWMLSISDYPS
jgi:hypothetical protein